MLNFFRKIRKKLAEDHKPIRYMRYALGEIVLVVIGILIALQINNWNEVQKEKLVEKQRYQNILNDLRNDAENIERMISQLIEKQDLHYYLYEVSQSNVSLDSAVDLGRINIAPELNLITGKNQLTELEFIKDLQIRREVNAYVKFENSALSDAQNLESLIKIRVRGYFQGIGAVKIENIFSPRRYDNDAINDALDIRVISDYFKDTDFKSLLITLRMNTSNTLISLKWLQEKNKILQTILKEKQ